MFFVQPEVLSKCAEPSLLHIGGLEEQINQWRLSEHKVCKYVSEQNVFNSLLVNNE